MKKMILLAIMSLFATGAYTAKVMTQTEFTMAFVQYLSKELPETQFSVVSDLRLYGSVNDYELNVFLDNAFDVYVSESQTINEVFQSQLNSIKNHAKTFATEDVKAIMPVIKPKEYILNARAQMAEAGYQEDELPLYYEKLNEDLFLMYVFDTTESMRFVSPEDVEKLDIKSSIEGIAKRNMELYFEKIGTRFDEIDTRGNGRIYMFAVDENYEASVLITNNFLKHANITVEGEPVLFLPARNFVLITGSKDSKATRLASVLAQKAYSELGYSISPYGYVNQAGQWQRFEQ
ncbi:MAG: DUF1444 family protein [Marinicella sp.]